MTQTIIGCAMAVHTVLGAGFLESVYQKAFTHRLRKLGLTVECQREIEVLYDSVVVGIFCADMLVEGTVLIEVKAVQSLVAAHEVQLVDYLTATMVETGLLVNFGASRLEFKRKLRTYRPKSNMLHEGKISSCPNHVHHVHHVKNLPFIAHAA